MSFIESSFGSTLPVMRKTTVEFSAFELTVMVLLKLPGRLAGLNATLIVPLPPGGIGFFVHVGDVQPHEAFTRCKTNG